MVQILNTLDTQPHAAYLPKRLAPAAEDRPVNGTEFIATKSHRIPRVGCGLEICVGEWEIGSESLSISGALVRCSTQGAMPNLIGVVGS